MRVLHPNAPSPAQDYSFLGLAKAKRSEKIQRPNSIDLRGDSKAIRPEAAIGIGTIRRHSCVVAGSASFGQLDTVDKLVLLHLAGIDSQSFGLVPDLRHADTIL